MLIKAVIVDDEPLAISRILKLLKNDDEIVTVAECKNAHDAINIINAKRPDLVFLDIQMPDLDGFSVITKLDPAHLPFFVFVTAFDQYALKAFDVHAIDYLLKPFDNERFYESVNRIKSQIKLKRTSSLKQNITGLNSEYQCDHQACSNSFSVKIKGVTKAINAENIYWVKAYGNYVRIHIASGKFMYRATMDSIEAKLKLDRFFRIHRSYIINPLYLESITYLRNNEYKFIMKNGKELISGRAYKENVERYLKDVY